jgi:alginate O-acetyltransferase complex protein AlgI
MVFSSFTFLFRFLPVVLLCYYIAPRRFRNFILLIASLIFYAWGEPIYVVLLLFSSVLDYTMGRLIGRFQTVNRQTAKKLCLFGSLLGNLLLLGVFKYADFFISSWNGITGMDIALLELSLPVGISFYTFQTLSYTIDVYRGKVPPQHNFITFAAYVSLFPQLIAGPIVRYQTVEAELASRQETLADFSDGAFRFVIGLAKKVLIANSIGALFQEIANLSGTELSTLTAWLGVLAFTFQIYFDFSGYSDMAIGLGRMFGFHFLENFEHPYEARSITEFWRRWHISLSTWFKEYVYIPLGGNQKGLLRQLFNIMLVWLLTGLWHGAAWNFVLWGVYYGILLVLEKCVLLHVLKRLPSAVQHFYTMVLVIGGWAFFCYPDVRYGGAFVHALLGQAQLGLADSRFVYLALTHLALFVIAVIGSTSLPKSLAERICTVANKGKYTVVLSCFTGIFVALCLFLSLTYLVSDSYNPFLYFRF